MEVEFERVSFSYGMTPDDVIQERVGKLAPDAPIGPRGKYAMGLNGSDLVTLLKALDYFGYSDATDAEKENAEGLRGSILETLNIEEI